LAGAAILWAAASAIAQENPGGSDTLPIELDHKQAARLVLADPKPEYPAVALVNYLQGHVQVKLTVDSQGTVTNAQVLNGNAVLAASALQAVRRWTYRPLSMAGGPAGFTTIVKMKFSLTSGPTELTPQRAERDFLRQVKPAKALPPHEEARSPDVAHLRVLVNDQGKVVDVEMSPPDRPQPEVEREVLRDWRFLPAQWGNLPVASYVNIDVPTATQSIARATTTVGGR
jgi:TonB family protein